MGKGRRGPWMQAAEIIALKEARKRQGQPQPTALTCHFTEAFGGRAFERKDSPTFIKGENHYTGGEARPDVGPSHCSESISRLGTRGNNVV